MTLLISAFSWVVSSIGKKPQAWLIGGFVAFALFVAALVYRAGERKTAETAARAAVTQSLAANSAQLVTAAVGTAAAHAAVGTAHRATVAANVVRDSAKKTSTAAAARESSVRSHVAIASDSTVSIDNAPPVETPAAVVSLIRSADTLRTADSVTLVADSATITATEHERDRIAAERDSIARQRDLYHERADTLQRALDLPIDTCGKLCETGKVAIATVTLYGVYRVGVAIARAVTAHGKATVGGTFRRLFF